MQATKFNSFCKVKIVKRFALAALSVLVCANLLPNAASAAGRVFYDNFESGTTSLWDRVGSGNMCSAKANSVDGVAPRAGSFNAECNWNGVVQWNDPLTYSSLTLNSWNYTREFLIRFWVRYAADVDRVEGGKLFRLYPDSQKDSFYLGGRMSISGGPLFAYFESINGAGGPINYGDGTIFGDGNWHKIEIYVKENTLGTSDGAVKVWLDGNLHIGANNVVSVAPNGRWYPLHVMSNWSSNPGWEHDANNHVYWDEIEIYSDAVTGATGSMADGTISMGGQLAEPPRGNSAPSAPSAIVVD